MNIPTPVPVFQNWEELHDYLQSHSAQVHDFAKYPIHPDCKQDFDALIAHLQAPDVAQIKKSYPKEAWERNRLKCELDAAPQKLRNWADGQIDAYIKTTPTPTRADIAKYRKDTETQREQYLTVIQQIHTLVQ